MLLELIVNLFFGLATFIIDLLPDMNLGGSNFFLALGNVYDVMDGASYLIPFGTFSLCMGVFFVLNNMTFVLSIFNWIIRKIPGVS